MSRVFTPTVPIMIGAARPSIRKVHFIEVGPRDGLQNETKVLDIYQKQELITALHQSGIRHIEAGSLVNYRKVPTMRGTREVLANIGSSVQATLGVLVPHVKELETLPPNANEIVLFVSASNTFNARNIGTDIEGAFERFGQIKEYISKNFGTKPLQIRGSISCCWGCPYEGETEISKILSIIERYLDLGATTIDICDTIGVATPLSTRGLLQEIFERFSTSNFSLHLHDTNGQAIDCALEGVSMGISTVQGSVGGIGGCPFSSKRVGNVDSVSLLKKLEEAGYETGVDTYALSNVKQWILKQLK